MKKLIYLIVCLTLLSCSKQEDVAGVSTTHVFVNPYENLGVIHNVAMDSIKKSQVTVEKLGKFGDDFVETHFDQEKDTLAKEVCHQISEDAKNIAIKYECCLTTRAMDVLTDSLVNTLPVNYRSYVSEVFDIVDKKMSDSLLINKEFSTFDEKVALSDFDI